MHKEPNMKKIIFCFFIIFISATLNADISTLREINLGGKVAAAPAIYNDRIYVIAEDRFLYSINNDGGILWKFNIKDWVRDSLTIGPDGTVYVCTGFGACIAVNKEGKEIWRAELESGPAGSPTIDFKGNIYIPTVGGKILNYSHSGRLKWTFDLGVAAAGPMTLDIDGRLYVITQDERVRAVDRYGREEWIFLCAGTPGPVLPISKDFLITGTDRNTIVAFTSEGEFIWNATMKAPLYSVLSDGEKIFAIDNSGFLACFDFQGNKSWDLSLNNVPSGGMVLGDLMNIFCEKGFYYLISKEGEIIDSKLFGGNFTGSALSQNGTIWAGNDNWRLYAFNSSIPGNTGWIQVGKDGTHSSSVLGYGAKNVYPDIPQKFNTIALRSMASSNNRDFRRQTLEQIEKDYISGEYYGKEDLYNELLYFLLTDGVTRQIRLGNLVANDFPEIRLYAAEILGIYGNLKSIPYLLEALENEPDETALRAVIEAVGNLGSDPKGKAVAALRTIIRRIDNYNLPDKMAGEVITGLEKLGRYSANYDEINQAVIDLFMSNISSRLKEGALQAMKSVRE